jgi:hypothetical protein
MRTYLFVVLWACPTLFLSGQTPEEDLNKVLQPLEDAPHLFYEATCYFFESGEKKPSDTLQIRLHRNGGREYRRIGRTEVLETPGLVVMADHDDRSVAVRSAEQEFTLPAALDIAALKKLTEGRQVRVKRTAPNTLTITSPDRPNENMTIRYDARSWALREVAITAYDPFAAPYEAPAGLVRVVVEFARFTTAPEPFRHGVSEYVKKSGDRYAATGKCKGYSVL